MSTTKRVEKPFVPCNIYYLDKYKYCKNLLLMFGGFNKIKYTKECQHLVNIFRFDCGTYIVLNNIFFNNKTRKLKVVIQR